MVKQIKNVNDVRDRLEVLYLNLESGAVKATDGKEQANVVGKMINSAKLQLEYQLARAKNEDIEIGFLDGK